MLINKSFFAVNPLYGQSGSHGIIVQIPIQEHKHLNIVLIIGSFVDNGDGTHSQCNQFGLQFATLAKHLRALTVF